MYRLIFLVLLFSCNTVSREKKILVVDEPSCDSSYFSLKDAMRNKACVVELHLRERGFTKIPTEINEFPNLKLIDLSFNSFDTFPSRLVRADLVSVLLGHADITNVSAQIGEWKKLESLTIFYCRLKSIPKEICNCENLKRLDLSGNYISDLPHCLTKMKSLKSLSVAKLDSEIGLSRETIRYFEKNFPDTSFFNY